MPTQSTLSTTKSDDTYTSPYPHPQAPGQSNPIATGKSTAPATAKPLGTPTAGSLTKSGSNDKMKVKNVKSRVKVGASGTKSGAAGTSKLSKKERLAKAAATKATETAKQDTAKSSGAAPGDRSGSGCQRRSSPYSPGTEIAEADKPGAAASKAKSRPKTSTKKSKAGGQDVNLDVICAVQTQTVNAKGTSTFLTCRRSLSCKFTQQPFGIAGAGTNRKASAGETNKSKETADKQTVSKPKEPSLLTANPKPMAVKDYGARYLTTSIKTFIRRWDYSRLITGSYVLQEYYAAEATRALLLLQQQQLLQQTAQQVSQTHAPATNVYVSRDSTLPSALPSSLPSAVALAAAVIYKSSPMVSRSSTPVPSTNMPTIIGVYI
ncbi:hypothetical protein SARC_09407 [Sphaeroforma arctica JP610]|uniref:Uncharacterized protein n=1 Tax=Sphaeroforma arctica JP610 TaxID=667725 RepID=A0A0L0FN44_9EUKA|nr:hypothetical protein SARC_09407 [Sphaeroforma arctica JP610]KNC78154.1 hypothetical protein SARC_09407 [Sphaeroforma arctica JP610]|eukprot:XP_014152056.1 hypothetical protein SARC_09407 [Sphaeroforma arctica JP610]